MFHVVALKCIECGGYNTVRIGDEEIPPDAVPVRAREYQRLQRERERERERQRELEQQDNQNQDEEVDDDEHIDQGVNIDED